MRMLALLAAEPELLSLFQAKCGGSTQPQIDAGGNPVKNTGLGMNLNHAYWPAMVRAFNDKSLIHDFPWEYVVDEDAVTYHSNGTDRVLTPTRVQNGFFAGLGIKQPRIPVGFYDGFFDVERLDSIFVNGMAEYHNAETNFHSSGQHGKPLWFFVTPVRTIVPEEQVRYLDDKQKRWDSLAFDCFKHQIQQVKLHFTKTVPNGVGGAPSVTPSGDAAAVTPPGSSGRVTLANRQQAQDAQTKELHVMQMQNLQSKADARVQCDVDVEIGKLDKIMRLQKMAGDFKLIGSSDMEDRCNQQADALKAELIKSDVGSLTFHKRGQGGNTPKTGSPFSPTTPNTPTVTTPA